VRHLASVQAMVQTSGKRLLGARNGGWRNSGPVGGAMQHADIGYAIEKRAAVDPMLAAIADRVALGGAFALPLMPCPRCLPPPGRSRCERRHRARGPKASTCCGAS